MRTHIEVDAVVLDLDDTLIREHDYVLSGYAAVATELATVLEESPSTLRRRLAEIFESPDRRRAFDVLLEPYGRTDLVGHCVNTYRGHVPSIQLTPSAEFLLQRLTGRVALGVVTDGPLVMQEAKVAALRLRERGLEVVCTDSLGGRDAWKPSPAGLLEVAERLGVQTERAVYVADNPHKDFVASSRAGMRSVRLRQPGQLHESCPAPVGGEPEAEIYDLAELWTVVALPISAIRPSRF